MLKTFKNIIKFLIHISDIIDFYLLLKSSILE